MKRTLVVTRKLLGSVPRRGFLFAGHGFVAIGLIGMALPLLPHTVFFVCALYCYKQSNPALADRLLKHRYIGRTLSDWDAGRTMRRSTKWHATLVLWVCLAVSIWLVAMWAKVMLVVIGLGVTTYMWTRPEPVPCAPIGEQVG